MYKKRQKTVTKKQWKQSVVNIYTEKKRKRGSLLRKSRKGR